MWDYFFSYGDKIYRSIGHLDRSYWIMILVGVLAVGFFCMRGFGSRTNY